MMLAHYLITAFRNLIRHKSYSIINIAGLAVGMACCLLIFIWVYEEYSYDRFHSKADRIYRLAEYTRYDNGFERTRVSAGTPLADAIKKEFPAVEAAVRFYRADGVIGLRNISYREKDLFFADNDLFEIFDFSLGRGDPETALEKPHTAVISKKWAEKYFGKTDPVGKVLKLDNQANVTITGILADMPSNSHFKFDFIASFETLLSLYPGLRNHWEAGVWTYVLLKDGYPPENLEKQLPILVDKYRDVKPGSLTKFFLQPLKAIHLYSNYGNEVESKTDVSTLITFSLIGLFILIMASINFVNLTTAIVFTRTREIGLRKVAGAGRVNLMLQFLGEAIVIALISLLAALVLVELLRPAVNYLLQKELSLVLFKNCIFWLAVIGSTLLVGFLSGIYPAFYLSLINPVGVLSGMTSGSSTVSLVRRSLVVFQYAVAITLIICTLIGYCQLRYLLQMDMGFQEDNLLVVTLDNHNLKRHYHEIKAAFLQNPGVTGVSGSSHLPGGDDCNALTFIVPGTNEKKSLPVFFVDNDFSSVLGLSIIDGRDVAAGPPAEAPGSLIINEAARSQLNNVSPGDRLEALLGEGGRYEPFREGRVIGIVKNFHFRNLYFRIQPQVLIDEPQRCDYLLVRLGSDNRETTLDILKSQWTERFPEQPFEASFLSDKLEQMYQSERNFAVMLNYFCFISVFIACIGLYGLAMAVTEQRSREIGIRRVLGASVSRLVTMISSEFLLLVLLANIIAWPAAYLLMNYWLSNYIYRINQGPGFFIAAAALALFISFMTVCYRSVKAALKEPVKVLRYE